jgi:succinyl-CoA synthetase beta subunit
MAAVIAFALGLEGKQVKECVALMGILYKAFVEKDMRCWKSTR